MLIRRPADGRVPRPVDVPRQGRRAAGPRLRSAVVGCLLLLVAATLLSGGVSAWERHQVDVVQGDLRDRLRPAQEGVVELTRAYVEQETGQRGFALTGRESFLDPYVRGRRDEEVLLARLADLLRSDAPSRALLDEVAQSGQRWQQDAAELEISARRVGPVSGSAGIALVSEGKVLFDVLRGRLAALDERVDQLTEDRLAQVSAAQQRANLASGAAALVALMVVGWTSVALTRSTTRPLAGLVQDLNAVAGGDTRRRIRGAGALEIRTIATAAETMRTSLVADAEALAASQRRVGVADEPERVARRVGDRTLSQLYGLTLALTRLRAVHPVAAAAVSPLVDRVDRIARELRAIPPPALRRGGTGRHRPRGSVIMPGGVGRAEVEVP